MVSTTEIPTLPPMLRNRFYNPLAFPFFSDFKAPSVTVDSGTNTQPSENPLMTMGRVKDHGDVSSVTRLQARLQIPKTVKPKETNIRVSILATKRPIKGMAMMDPRPRGET